MIVLMIAVTVLAVGLLVAVPSVYQEARREREAELLFRGQQYARAIYLFQQHFNRYPNSVNELLHTDNMSFLRKAWPDPMTPGGKWRFIHVSGGGALLDSWTVGQQSRLPFSGSGSNGSNSAAGSGSFGSLGSGSNASGSSSFGSLGGSAASSPGAAAAPSSSSAFAWPPPDSGSAAQAGDQFGAGFSLGSGSSSGSQSGLPAGSADAASAGASSTSPAQSGGSMSGRPLDSNGKPKKSPDCAGTGQHPDRSAGSSSSYSKSSSSSSSSSAFGFNSGPQGLGIAGVASCSDEASLRIFNSKKHYSEWEFLGVGFSAGGLPASGGSTATPPASGQGGTGTAQQGSPPGNVFPAGQPPEPPTPDQDNPNPGENANPGAPGDSSNPPNPSQPPPPTSPDNPPPR